MPRKSETVTVSHHAPLDSLLADIRTRLGSMPAHAHVTLLQVEAGLLWSMAKRAKQDVSVAQIASALRRPGKSGEVSVGRALREFRANVEWIDLLRRELFKANFRREAFWAEHRTSFLAEIAEKRRKMIEAGLWPFEAPEGYAVDRASRILRADPRHGPRVKEFFKRVSAGEYPNKVGRDLGLRVVDTHQMLKNPVYRPFVRGGRKGCISFGGKIYQGQHDALVDYETFSRANFMVKSRGRKHPFGLLWGPDEQLIVDPVQEPRLRQICSLFSKTKTAEEIGRTLHCTPENVRTVLLGKDYSILGKDWEQAHSRAIVWSLAGKNAGGLRKGLNNELRYLAQLVQNGGSTEDTFLRRHHEPLYRLSAKGWIDRKGGKRGPWVVRDLAAAKAVVESGDSARLMKTSALG